MAENSAWLMSGLEDDVRPRMFEVADQGDAFALATIVKADGTARLEVPDGIDGDTTYDIWYFADGNDNATCDEQAVDAKRHETLDPGTVEIATSSLSVNIGTEGVCDYLR